MTRHTSEVESPDTDVRKKLEEAKQHFNDGKPGPFFVTKVSYPYPSFSRNLMANLCGPHSYRSYPIEVNSKDNIDNADLGLNASRPSRTFPSLLSLSCKTLVSNLDIYHPFI